MWHLIPITLSAILVLIMIMKFKFSRKRILADKIPGPDGSLFVGMLPLFMQGPEKLITNGATVYRE